MKDNTLFIMLSSIALSHDSTLPHRFYINVTSCCCFSRVVSLEQNKRATCRTTHKIATKTYKNYENHELYYSDTGKLMFYINTVM